MIAVALAGVWSRCNSPNTCHAGRLAGCRPGIPSSLASSTRSAGNCRANSARHDRRSLVRPATARARRRAAKSAFAPQSARAIASAFGASERCRLPCCRRTTNDSRPRRARMHRARPADSVSRARSIPTRPAAGSCRSCSRIQYGIGSSGRPRPSCARSRPEKPSMTFNPSSSASRAASHSPTADRQAAGLAPQPGIVDRHGQDAIPDRRDLGGKRRRTAPPGSRPIAPPAAPPRPATARDLAPQACETSGGFRGAGAGGDWQIPRRGWPVPCPRLPPAPPAARGNRPLRPARSSSAALAHGPQPIQERHFDHRAFADRLRESVPNGACRNRLAGPPAPQRRTGGPALSILSGTASCSPRSLTPPAAFRALRR